MASGRLAQAVEKSFEWSEYVDFPSDNSDNENILTPTTTMAPSTAMPEPSENMNVDDQTAERGGVVDGSSAGMAQSPRFVDPMDLQVSGGAQGTFAAPAGTDGSDASQDPNSSADLGAMDDGSGDANMEGPVRVPDDLRPKYLDALSMSPEPQGENVADGFQIPSGAGAGGMSGGDFVAGDAMAFDGGVDSVPYGGVDWIVSAEEIRQIWSMDPELQALDMADNFQTPFGGQGIPDGFPVVDQMAFAGRFELNPTPQEIEQPPSMWAPVSPEQQQQLNSEFAPQLGLLAADPNPPPALFLPAEGSSVQPAPNTPFVPSAEVPWEGFPTLPQFVAGASNFDPTPTVQKPEDEASRILRRLIRRGTSGAKDDDYDDTLDADGEIDSDDSSDSSGSSDPPAAHASANLPAQANNRKSQNLLKEIENSKNFVAEAQSAEVGKNGRPVRKGARKNYEGQD